MSLVRGAQNFEGYLVFICLFRSFMSFIFEYGYFCHMSMGLGGIFEHIHASL